MRLLIIFVILAFVVLVPFVIWGDSLEAFFTQQATIDWLVDYGYWAWAVAILLLASDLLLPLPATTTIAALGIMYGPWLGGLIGAAGSLAAGTLGYEICRRFGIRTARRLLGEKDWERAQRLDKKVGGVLIVISRWTPVLPEVVSCMAGLIRMQRLKFYLAQLLAALPFACFYAWVGFTGKNFPAMTLILTTVLPVLLWLLLRNQLRRRQII